MKTIESLNDLSKKIGKVRSQVYKYYSDVYRIYKQVDKNKESKKYFINQVVAKRPSSEKLLRRQSISTLVAWEIYPCPKRKHSRSDLKCIIEYAKKCNVSPDDFVGWVEKLGGVRAVLSSSRQVSSDGSKSRTQNLGKKLNSTFEDLFQEFGLVLNSPLRSIQPSNVHFDDSERLVQIVSRDGESFTCQSFILSANQEIKPVASSADDAPENGSVIYKIANR